MSALQKHLQKLGINVHLLWQRIYDCIIKSYISVEDALWNMMQKIQGKSSKSNCFELLGFDIMLDDKLNPWVLEVNLAPSLTADSPLDFHIKTNLAVDVFNVVGIRRPVKRGA